MSRCIPAESAGMPAPARPASIAAASAPGSARPAPDPLTSPTLVAPPSSGLLSWYESRYEPGVGGGRVLAARGRTAGTDGGIRRAVQRDGAARGAAGTDPPPAAPPPRPP